MPQRLIRIILGCGAITLTVPATRWCILWIVYLMAAFMAATYFMKFRPETVDKLKNNEYQSCWWDVLENSFFVLAALICVDYRLALAIIAYTLLELGQGLNLQRLRVQAES